MNLLCPQNYIPSNLSTSMDELEISLRSAPAQLQKVYRQKNSCDMVLKFDGKQYLVHRYVIEKTSTMFSKGFVTKQADKWYLQVNVKAKTDLFTKILSCMYGHSTTIRRYDLHEAYEIGKTLQIPSLLHQLQNDMMTHFDQYDIFPLLKLATREKLTELMDLCYDQLEIQMYEPMRYNKSGLFLCDIELFKSIVKRHNFKKSNNEKFGLSFGEIRQLIDQYSFVNSLTKQQKDKLIEQIDDKQNMRYYISLNQVFRKPTTPSRTKSTSEIFQRATLTLPRQKDQEKNSYLSVKNRRFSPCVNSFTKSNDQIDYHEPENSNQTNQVNQTNQTVGSSPLICKSDSSTNSKSISNISTDNKSLQNRSRKQSTGSVQTISDPKILVTIAQISQSQKSLQQSQTEMKFKASEIVKKLKTSIQHNKYTSSKMHKMESSLEELKAQITCSKDKLRQLQKTVDNVGVITHQKQIQQRFDKLFETNIDLDLTQSTEIHSKEPSRMCKI